MTALLIASAALGHLAATLYIARHLYGRWRATDIDRNVTRRRAYSQAGLHVHLIEARNSFNVDRTYYMTGALAAAFVWPVTLAAIGIYRWLDSSPVQSATELEADRNRMAARLADLERDLGITNQEHPHA